MKIVCGVVVELITYNEYRKRFPTELVCRMCPIKDSSMCNCPVGKVYVEASERIIWR